MFKIKVAGFVAELHNQYPYVEKQCASYRCTEEAADIVVSVSPEEVEAECRRAGASNGEVALAESICLYRKLCLQLPEREALLMHGVVIEAAGRGILFTAPSGTGKTTHALLWKKRYADEVTIVNGDKPIVRFCEGLPLAFGTPWSGKERLQANKSVELTDICFIERSAENSVERVEPKHCLDRLIPQVLRHPSPIGAIQTLELVDRLTKRCRFWIVRCNMEEEAAGVAYEAIVKA